AVDRPRVVQPGVVAKLAGPRDGMEDPYSLPGPHVERANVAARVVVGFRRLSLTERGADNHQVAGDRGRRVQPDFSGDEIDLLIEIELEIDDAVAPERRNPLPG